MIPDRAFSFCSSIRTPAAPVLPRLCYRQLHHPPANERNQVVYHHIRPPPARRRRTSSSSRSVRHGPTQTRSAHNILCALLLCLLFVCPGAIAHEVYGASEILPTELLFDRSEPPTPYLPRMLLERRQGDLPSTATKFKHYASATAGSTIQTATSTPPVTLPTPFDTNLGNNFTSNACPAFFKDFLENETFLECLPFSLLLQTSSGFFSVSQSLVRLTQTLDASCNVDFDQCSALMSKLAQEIQEDATCGPDLQMQNPIVTQAYNGLIAYPTLYHAGCLTNSDGNYCFSNAVTNASAPSSSYIYFLPLGVQLPGGAKPTCNPCLQKTMAIFAESASDTSQPLSTDYVGAAQQIQMICGPTFVQAVVASSANPSTATKSTRRLAGLVLLLTLFTNIF